jgi:hypothetical protein
MLKRGILRAVDAWSAKRGPRMRCLTQVLLLLLWTSPGSGTEVELCVPASRAYATPSTLQHPLSLAKLIWRRTPDSTHE